VHIKNVGDLLAVLTGKSEGDAPAALIAVTQSR
jgi:hypothetical protein